MESVHAVVANKRIRLEVKADDAIEAVEVQVTVNDRQHFTVLCLKAEEQQKEEKGDDDKSSSPEIDGDIVDIFVARNTPDSLKGDK